MPQPIAGWSRFSRPARRGSVVIDLTRRGLEVHGGDIMATTTAAHAFAGFPKDAFAFFRELKRNNTREWFQANKDRYEAVCREPMKRLIADLGEDPKSAHITRINRDLRFSRDKSPYRAYIATGVR